MPFHLTREDPDYPPLLKEISDPPEHLWGEGDPRLLSEVCLAVVGARECTAYGEKTAFQLAKELAGAGIVVVSGLAHGIDSAAHRGALAGNGKTIAVLGAGLDVPYPSQNGDLRRPIEERGAVVSEFPPGTGTARWTFPKRNRIVSGLSRGVVVVEAAEKSGALITADFALQEGREVFAVPGNMDSPTSAGTNRLIQNGAKLVTNIFDILEELKIEKRAVAVKERVCGRTTEEEKVLTLLSNGPRYMDELVSISGFSVEKVSVLLTELEIVGKVKSLPGSRFERIG
jgi:DNA processing protein